MFRRPGAALFVLLTATATVSIPSSASATPHAAAKVRQVMNVAHRGASAHAPENTLAAFKRAKPLGARVFELDVQQTKDRKLILMHDTTLSRTTNVESRYPKRRPWRVKDFTLAEIKKLDAGSWFGRSFKGEKVPTLDEALRTMQGSGLHMLLELKNPQLYPGMTGRVVKALRARPYWVWPGRLTVQSFWWRHVKAVNGELPSTSTAVLGEVSPVQAFQVSGYADAVHTHHSKISAAYVARAHAAGLEVQAYTVDDTATMRRLIWMGVDGIITNRPDRLRSVLRS